MQELDLIAGAVRSHVLDVIETFARPPVALDPLG
jgi:hypothetical protein